MTPSIGVYRRPGHRIVDSVGDDPTAGGGALTLRHMNAFSAARTATVKHGPGCAGHASAQPCSRRHPPPVGPPTAGQDRHRRRRRHLDVRRIRAPGGPSRSRTVRQRLPARRSTRLTRTQLLAVCGAGVRDGARRGGPVPTDFMITAEEIDYLLGHSKVNGLLVEADLTPVAEHRDASRRDGHDDGSVGTARAHRARRLGRLRPVVDHHYRCTAPTHPGRPAATADVHQRHRIAPQGGDRTAAAA